MFYYLSLLPALFFTHGEYWDAYWQDKWAVLMWGLCAAISLGVGGRLSWFVAPFVAILLGSSVYQFAWNHNLDSAYTAFVLLAFITYFMFLNIKSVYAIVCFCTIACITSIIYTLINPRGFVGNLSMNGCLIAFTLPMALRCFNVVPTLKTIVAIFAALAIIRTNASIPIGCLFVALAAYATAKKKYWILFAGLGLFVIGYLIQGPTLLDDNGRIPMWFHVTKWWLETGKIWFGVGTGTGPIVFRNIAYLQHNHNYFGQWVHSDYLQVLFENGVIGFAALMLLVASVLVRTFDKPWMFASCCSYMACALFNYPAHLPIHAFIGAALVWMAHVKKAT